MGTERLGFKEAQGAESPTRAGAILIFDGGDRIFLDDCKLDGVQIGAFLVFFGAGRQQRESDE